MKVFLWGLRHFFVSFVAGVLAGDILFRMDHFFCGDLNGEASAGGGAALGMVALTFLISVLLFEFTILVSVDLARHFGFITWCPRWRVEAVSVVLVLVISSAVAYQLTSSPC
jgi:hypothetical protein